MYISKNKRVLAIVKGDTIVRLQIDGKEQIVNDETIKLAAQAANEVYHYYRNYTDLEIMMKCMVEI